MKKFIISIWCEIEWKLHRRLWKKQAVNKNVINSWLVVHELRWGVPIDKYRAAWILKSWAS